MAQQKNSTLKSYFQTGDRPTQTQFAELIDSFLNKEDMNVTVDPLNKNIGIGLGKDAMGQNILPNLANKLEINGKLQATGLTIPTGAQANYVLTADASGNATWRDPLQVSNDGDWAMGTGTIFNLSENIGIGLNNPTEKLEINGNVKTNNLIANGLKIGTTTTPNSVLTSDSVGNATWQDLNTLVANDGDWVRGTGTVFNLNDNVGIGLNNPSQKLDVVGKIKATNLQLTDAAAIGRFLTSDGSGNAGWNADVRMNGKTLEFLGTNSSVSIGQGAGDGGSGNTFLGYYAGNNNTSGYYNSFLGHEAGNNNTSGYYNSFLGFQAGKNNTEGYWNVFLGYSAGHSNTTGNRNVYIGGLSGGDNIEGLGNTCLGFAAGYTITSGDQNLFLGSWAGFSTMGGKGNVFIGSHSGYNNKGVGNLFLGQRAGVYESGSNILYISNSDTNTPLIYGDFNSGYIEVNGAVVQTSDQKTKKDITQIPSLLQKLKQLNPVSYHFKSEKRKGKSIGFIAQEIRTIFPELVVERAIKDITEADHQEMEKLRTQIEKAEDPKPLMEKMQQKLKSIPMTSILGIKYLEIIPIAIKGIQEQQAIIEAQNTTIDDLNTLYTDLLKRVKRLEKTSKKP